ncbi:hypothetical protein KZF14_000128 [Campylobacter jejuni]|uniref:Uncharacterized protein n=3 Tax=Campylobacter jejuni TaxID=197 RepID=A0AAX2M2B1_CAMJU|nr:MULTISPECIES: hypothetical protein [Campylobacter]EIB57932.1 hypothetical protein cje160_01025 [Campylobacter jejuni subsp. jejuni 2008-979]PJQ90594.1 hypothetical protein CV441_01820 [Campylobacter jejuni subsp. jejuni]APA46903.1 hypothetical protein BLD42_02440 [Campylobacter jejuni]ATD41110.1 Uncharacterized protein CLH93_0492 [Campylobacter jejuni]AVS36969.1 hypothetical protein C9J79_04920 [Campylobacter jejuni]
MAIINFMYFLDLLSLMSEIKKEILIENQHELLKYLSHLGENEKFDSNKCFEALNNIDENYFICIGLINKEEQKEFCKNIFIILKTKWSSFSSCFC